MTSGVNAKGRFGKQDFVYVAADDVYLWIGDIHKAWRTVPMRFTDLMAGDTKGRSRLPLEAAADPIRSTQWAQADHAPRRCAGPLPK
jgi:hypothetical protein